MHCLLTSFVALFDLLQEAHINLTISKKKWKYKEKNELWSELNKMYIRIYRSIRGKYSHLPKIYENLKKK